MKIAVIIPTLNEDQHIAAAIHSVRRQCSETEIIVADGGSADKTVEISQRRARVISSKPGRAVQMNAGARQTEGELLLFLHADSLLPGQALADLRRVMANSRVAGGTFMLKFDRNHPFLNLYAYCTRFKCRYFHYGDQGIFARRSVFEQMGGFQEMSLMEDFDFLLRLRRMGEVTLIRSPVITSARRYLKHGVVRQQLLNIGLVLLYLLGVNSNRLAVWYRANTPILPPSGDP